MEPLRVLHVFGIMNRGGAETLIMNVYRNIDRQKVQFDFLVHKEEHGAFEDEIRILGGKIHRVKYVPEVGHFNYVKELKRFFSQHSYYKIVHSHIDQMSGLPLREAKRASVPVRISHSHNTKNGKSLLEKMYKSVIQQLILPNATDYFACSSAAARWLFGSESLKAKIVKNGIETDAFVYKPDIREKVREDLYIPKDCMVIGHVGRFDRQKNHTFLIDIFHEVNKLYPQSLLLLVGVGDLKENIKEKVNSLGLGKQVVFLGVRDDVNQLMQSLDLFVLPSFYEGFPIVSVEAQAAGLPCIIADSITEESNIVKEAVTSMSLGDHPGKWAEEIIKAYGHRFEGAAAKIRESGYDIADTAHFLETFYKERIYDVQGSESPR